LAILSVEKIDLDGRGLGNSIRRERRKNKSKDGNKKLSHNCSSG
jgi:hypothetical protein